jgi:hypothetical protein
MFGPLLNENTIIEIMDFEEKEFILKSFKETFEF